MNELQEKQIKVLDETVAYYEQDPSRRSFGIKKGCAYNGVDNKRCAIARIADVPIDILNKWDYVGSISRLFLNKSTRNTIPDHLSELGVDFLALLQSYHDDNRHWENFDSEETTKLRKDYEQAIRNYILAQ